MAVTHSITLMESCFQEMLTAALFSPPSVEYKRNAFENLPGLNSPNRPLSDILTQKPVQFLDDVLKAYISGLSLTNYKDVTRHFKAVAGVRQVNAFQRHEAPMKAAVLLRNDMVHRNGAGMDGKPHEVGIKILQEHIATVRSFICAVSEQLDEKIDYDKKDKKQK